MYTFDGYDIHSRSKKYEESGSSLDLDLLLGCQYNHMFHILREVR